VWKKEKANFFKNQSLSMIPKKASHFFHTHFLFSFSCLVLSCLLSPTQASTTPNPTQTQKTRKKTKHSAIINPLKWLATYYYSKHPVLEVLLG
jgi:hypothetical protein